MQKHQVGPYRILFALSQDTLNPSFKAIDARTGQAVHLRSFYIAPEDQKVQLAQVLHELNLQKNLLDTHLVKWIDVYFESATLYIASIWIEGWALQDIVKQSGRIPPLVSLAIAWQCAEGIHNLHKHDKRHPSVCCSHILLGNNGYVYLSDLDKSLSQVEIANSGRSLSRPELSSDLGQQRTALADFYDLGLVLYEMIAGDVERLKLDERFISGILEKSATGIDMLELPCNDLMMQISLRLILQQMLMPKASQNYLNGRKISQFMLKTLLKFGVKNPFSAVWQYLAEERYQVAVISTAQLQEIYCGYVPEVKSQLRPFAKES